MPRYIDADALLQELQEEIECDTPMYAEEQNQYVNRGLKIAIKDIKHMSTADVVEVVRCKECVHSKSREKCPKLDIYWCNKWLNIMNANDFCSYGEKKDETTM